MIFRLLVITVNTGLWTAIFAIIDLALVSVVVSHFYVIVVFGPECSPQRRARLFRSRTNSTTAQ